MIGCEQMEELLPLYVDGGATPDERTLVEKHIGQCEDCRIMVYYLRRVDVGVAALPVVPERMRPRLREIDEGVRRRTQRRRLPLPSLRLFNGALGLAGPVGAVLLISAIALLLSSILAQIQQAKTPEVPVAKLQLGKIAIIRAGDIWVKELPDGEAKRLTQDGRNSKPLWSPSGEWLAFRKGMQVWVIRGSGNDAHKVQGDDIGEFSWSPVADRLAYVTSAGLFTVNADGSDVRKVVERSGGFAWSPDGNWLAFERSEQVANQPPSAQGLWRVKADGTEMQEVYSSPNPAESQFKLIDWSPDSQFLLYWSGMLQANSVTADGLPLMRVQVTGPSKGRTPVEITRMMMVNPDFLDWSPNGQRLAFVDGGQRMSWENKRIAVVDGSGAARVLSEQGRANLFPAWSPDGNRIAYVSGPAAPGVGGGDEAKQAMAQRHIWVMASDGSGKRELTNDPAYRDERPRWSRDGAFILFARMKDEHVQLWMMRADGSEQRLVADDLSVPETGSASPPIWFGFYGNIGWGQFYDWWTSKSVAKPTTIQPTPAATSDARIIATPEATPAATELPGAEEWAKVVREVRTIPVLRPAYLPVALVDATPKVSVINLPNGAIEYSVRYLKGNQSLSITGREGTGLVVHQTTPQTVVETIAFRGGRATVTKGTYSNGNTRMTIHWHEVAKPPSSAQSAGAIADFLIDSSNLQSEEVIRAAESLQSVGVVPAGGSGLPPSSPTPQSPAAVADQTDGWKTYSSLDDNMPYNVTLQYPPSWEPDPRYTFGPASFRYRGVDGFFTLSSIDADTIDEAATHLKGNHIFPWGSNPTVTKTQVQGQDAHLIMPSGDQTPEMDNQAALIILSPKPIEVVGSSYRYLVLLADKDHIQAIAGTLRFGSSSPAATATATRP